MKTLTITKNLFLTEKNELSFFPFPMEVVSSGKYCNYEIVEQMAADGDDEAKKAIEKLKVMTSRQRSESGIYYKIQQKKSFNQTKSKLFGVRMYVPVSVEFTAEISKKSKSRLQAFRLNADYFGKVYFRVPYTNEMMLINKKITIL